MEEREIRELAIEFAGKWVDINRWKFDSSNEIDAAILRVGRAKVVGFWKPYNSWRFVCFVEKGVGTHYDQLSGMGMNITSMNIDDYYTTLVGIPPEDLLFDAVIKSNKDYPHSCLCGSPAFILFQTVECSNYYCKHFIRNS